MATTLGVFVRYQEYAVADLLGLFVTHWLLGTAALITPQGILGGGTVLTLIIVDGAGFLGLKTRGTLHDDAIT